MTSAEQIRPRGALGVLLLCAAGLVLFPLAVALFVVGLAGIVLLIAGLLSWLHPVDVAAAWARTLAGMGLIGGSTAFAAIGWLAVRAVLRRENSMNHRLKFVAVLGILLALICLPFAAAIRASAHEAWFGWQRSSWLGNDGDSGGSDAMVTRDFPWNGGDRLEFDIAGHVRFHPAPTWHLTISARQETLDQLLVEDGHIKEKTHFGFSFFGSHDLGPVQVDLSGPALREASLNGSGSIDLQGLNQDTLHLEIRGSGAAGGSGQVQSLKLEIMGSGTARLAPLATKSADVTIDGSGDADISPTGDTEVTIAGSGDVRLHAHPAQLNTHVYGSGRISEVRS